MPWRPPVHQPAIGSTAQRRVLFERWRGSAASRGYDAAWKRFRLGFLRSNPLCVDCLTAGHLTPATDVHHKRKLRDHPELRFDASKAMSLCHGCHSVRTANGE
jgi:5-methylcytosine-specific restriction enzyme A